jgi:hypothetical protein
MLMAPNAAAICNTLRRYSVLLSCMAVLLMSRSAGKRSIGLFFGPRNLGIAGARIDKRSAPEQGEV